MVLYCTVANKSATTQNRHEGGTKFPSIHQRTQVFCVPCISMVGVLCSAFILALLSCWPSPESQENSSGLTRLMDTPMFDALHPARLAFPQHDRRPLYDACASSDTWWNYYAFR
jgi:hypothetical protein